MNRYISILGHVPILSSIEAKILIPDLMIESMGDGYMIASSASCDALELMRISGGLVKIAREYAQVSDTDLAGIIVTALQETMPSGKITFGVSIYGEVVNVQADRLAMQVKNVLKGAGRSVRHVFSKDKALNSASLLFNDFAKPGHVEICLIPTQHTSSNQSLRHPRLAEALAKRASQEGNKGSPPTEGWLKDGVGDDSQGQIGIYITEAFQDVSEYTELERLLGFRDDRSGVLPLRLVKMLLNLADVQNEHTLLDPFCGSGILIGVAALRGTRNIIASDISVKAVRDTRKNIKNAIASVRSHVECPPLTKGRNKEGLLFDTSPDPSFERRGQETVSKDFDIKIDQRDVRDLSKHIQPASIDRIVTEPTLGPSSRVANKKEREELSQLYINSFREFKKVLKPDGKVLFIFPVFEGVGDFTRAQNEISQMGFRKVDLMKDVQQFFPGVSEPVYSRPQQRVKRLITVWTLQ